MKTVVASPIPSHEEVLTGIRRAVQKLVEKAKRDDDVLSLPIKMVNLFV
ncbi:hypothetical protein [Spirosoma knui]